MKKLYNDTPFINKKKAVSNEELSSQLAQNVSQLEVVNGVVTVNVDQYADLVVGGDWSDAFQAAVNSIQSSLGTVLFTGALNVSKPIVINTIGVTIKGLGYRSRLKAVNFVGSDIIKFENTNPSYSINKNVVIENLVVDCNNQPCNGINVAGAYDMCKISNVEIWRTNGSYRGLIMTEDAQQAVAQTILLENVLAYHFDNTATVESMYFRKCQEVNMIGVKAFGSQVTAAQNADCMVLEDCRGVTMTGCSIGFGKGLRIKATTRNSTGITLTGTTFEETYTNALITQAAAGLKVDSLFMFGSRMQGANAKITLNETDNALLFTNLFFVELITGNNNAIFANDSSKVTDTGVKTSVIGFRNANMDYLVLPTKIRTQSIYNGTQEVIRTTSSPGVNSTGMLLYVNGDGTTSIRQVLVGLPDSGGTGYRALRVSN